MCILYDVHDQRVLEWWVMRSDTSAWRKEMAVADPHCSPWWQWRREETSRKGSRRRGYLTFAFQIKWVCQSPILLLPLIDSTEPYIAITIHQSMLVHNALYFSIRMLIRPVIIVDFVILLFGAWVRAQHINQSRYPLPWTHQETNDPSTLGLSNL